MPRFLPILLLLLFLVLGRAVATTEENQPSPASQTIVVFNSSDPDSSELAKYYATRRGISDDHVIGVDCPVTEEISRDEFDQQIARPLRDVFSEKNWWTARTGVGAIAGPGGSGEVAVTDNTIRFVALIRGIPLKIREQATYPGDVQDSGTPVGQTNAASVDSELTVLALNTSQISGMLRNPYFDHFSRFTDAVLPLMMLVCRLDGPQPRDVMRMIDDSIRAERSGLWGWACVDARGVADAGYKEGDEWLFTAAKLLHDKDFPVIADRQEPIYPAGMVLPRMAVYLGWYAGDFSGAIIGSRFEPGAVACHIHSFSAATLRSFTAGWCGPMIAAGAAATLGNVYEPYLAYTANLGIFMERLLRGWTFAESSWASIPELSWMTVNVGDPLYRPFALLTETGQAKSRTPVADFRRSADRNSPDGSTPFLAEAWANRKWAEADATGAAGMFELALRKTTDSNAIARLTWTYGQMLLSLGNKEQAIALVRTSRHRVGMGAAGTFLQTWLAQLQPPAK